MGQKKKIYYKKTKTNQNLHETKNVCRTLTEAAEQKHKGEHKINKKDNIKKTEVKKIKIFIDQN